MRLSKSKVTVTGADGFIGSHLTEALVAMGCRVKALAYYNSFNSWGWLDALPGSVLDNVEVVSGDIRDRGSVAKVLEGSDCVFHLAALIGIPYSYYSPESYVDTNIHGTLNVLEVARAGACGRVLVTSTSEVYGTAQYVPIDESHPFQGQSPYSATKIGADRIAESYYRSFELPVTIVRPFNTYGPRQSARAVIPTIITQLNAGRDEIKLGSLNPTRDLVFVRDTVAGFIALAEEDAAIGQEVNIATGCEISVGDLVQKIIAMVRPGSKVICDGERLRPVRSEVERLLGCNKRMRSLTKWVPQYSLDAGLQETVEWFSAPGNLSRYKPGIYNV
ncbi:MAG: GDP-mannose 4,6-dehydratase [Verrucomicrobiae bacterium]|nr:GDP-mannose 4,6-dehydratase [Verrucomicrobiae bacterium]